MVGKFSKLEYYENSEMKREHDQLGNRIIAMSVAAGVGLSLTAGSIKMGSNEHSKGFTIQLFRMRRQSMNRQ